jgi:hypothetical protein
MTCIPDTLDARLTRDGLAEALTEAGFPTSAKTLATKASRGGGPPFRKFGPRAIYTWGDAVQWAEARLSAPRRSTSESDAGLGLRGSLGNAHALRPQHHFQKD